MSAPDIDDDDNESASSLLADAIAEGGSEDRAVDTNDVAALAADLAAAKADIKARNEAGAVQAREVQQARTALQTEQERRLTATEQAITNGAAAAQAEVDRLTAEAATAQSEGRWSDAATLTRKAAVQEMKLQGFEDNRAQLAGERERLKTQQTADPLARLSPRTRQWVEAHPRFTTDQLYFNWANMGHQEAVARKLQPDTDEYFAYVERRIAENEASMNGTPTQARQTPGEIAAAADPAPARQQNAATTAAPVTRRTQAPANGSRPGAVRLTPEQRDAANRLFADLYSTEKERLEHYVAQQQRVDQLKAEGRFAGVG